MPLHPTWDDISVRILLTIIAGALIGLNRESSGHAAGFRTTILVGLAACITMVLANLLVSIVGKEPNSFVNMDVLRLPLGILTGVGFIGGGTILKRDNLVTGVTTAATLWVMTAIGLAFGSGQIGLAAAATAIAYVVLWLFKRIDPLIPREQRARLSIVHNLSGAIPDIQSIIGPLGYRAHFLNIYRTPGKTESVVSFEIRWHRPEAGRPPYDLLEAMQKQYFVQAFDTEKDTASR